MNEIYVQRELARVDLRRALRDARCVVAGDPPEAMAIVEPYGERLRAVRVAGRGRAFGVLMRALPAEAAHRRKRHITVSASSDRWRQLRAAGYRRVWSDSMFLFEKRL